MAAYRRVYDSRHLQADCQEPGSAPEPYARQSSMDYLFCVYNNLISSVQFSWCDVSRQAGTQACSSAKEACSLRRYQCKSINYVINSTFRKIFNTRSQETVVTYAWKCLVVSRLSGQLRYANASYWTNCRERTAKTVNCCIYSYFV